MKDFTLNDGKSNPGMEGFRDNTNRKLPVVNWLADLPETQTETDLVEVQFKNTRKGYFINNTKIPLEKGDQVAVEASPGHDIGMITLIGRLVPMQMKKNRINLDRYEVKRVYRKVRPLDIEKYEEAKGREHETMIKARKIAMDLHLSMKIGDVEYQGDGSKAIFYYIADERVDFRQLIKVFAEEFRVRIEMKQIGARQEAGRIGGIGPCGRELCCATWMNNFVSVSTNSARFQDLSTNPLKLAGQCAKIKCCVNYEMGMYADLKKDVPSRDTRLVTKDATFFQFKTDIFKREMTFSSDPRMPSNLVTLPIERVQQIIEINRRGEKVDHLTDNVVASIEVDYQNVVGQDDLNRFDKSPRSNNRKRGNRKRIGEDRKDAKDEFRAPRSNRNARPNRNDRNVDESRPKDDKTPVAKVRRSNNNNRPKVGSRPQVNNNGDSQVVKKSTQVRQNVSKKGNAPISKDTNNSVANKNPNQNPNKQKAVANKNPNHNSNKQKAEGNRNPNQNPNNQKAVANKNPNHNSNKQKAVANKNPNQNPNKQKAVANKNPNQNPNKQKAEGNRNPNQNPNKQKVEGNRNTNQNGEKTKNVAHNTPKGEANTKNVANVQQPQPQQQPKPRAKVKVQPKPAISEFKPKNS